MEDRARDNLKDLPELFYAGYTQDALKEYAEAALVYALINNGEFPSPEYLNLESATYLQGLAEAVGELRRRCLDMLLKDNPNEAERLMGEMDDIYGTGQNKKTPDDSREKRNHQGFGIHYGATYFFFLGSSFLASSLTSIFVAFIT